MYKNHGVYNCPPGVYDPDWGKPTLSHGGTQGIEAPGESSISEQNTNLFYFFLFSYVVIHIPTACYIIFIKLSTFKSETIYSKVYKNIKLNLRICTISFPVLGQVNFSIMLAFNIKKKRIKIMLGRIKFN